MIQLFDTNDASCMNNEIMSQASPEYLVKMGDAYYIEILDSQGELWERLEVDLDYAEWYIQRGKVVDLGKELK